MTKEDIKHLKKIRNYFGEHDKTNFEHIAYTFLDRIIKESEAAEKQQDEMMIKFAEWIGLQQTNIKRIGENTWVQIEGENLATRDLLQQFKETLK